MSENGCPAADRTRRRNTVVAIAALVLLVFLVHGRTLGTDWAWASDDTRFIVKNPNIARPPSWTSFFTDMRTTDPLSPGGIVRPLRTLEFAVDAQIAGLNPSAFRLHSLLWFSAGVVFLFLLLRDLLGDARAAIVGAAIWAVHPMQTEAVQWISSRGDVAAGALSIAAVWAARRVAARDRWLAASLASSGLAMLYKESAVVIPALVVIVRCIGPRRMPFLRSVVASWPWLAIAGVYLVYRSRVLVGDTSHVTTYVLGGSTAGTFATMARGFGAYVLFALLPVRPTIDWYLTASSSLAEPTVLAWLAVHLALLGWGLAALNRGRCTGAAVVWFYAALVPVANWPFYLGIPTTERFLHLALAGFALLVALAFRCALRSSRAAWAAAAVAVLACGAISFRRALDWRSDSTLWPATARVVESPIAEGFFAAETRRDGVAGLTAALRLPAGPQRDAEERAAREILERALDHAHRALRTWARIEGTPRSDTFPVAFPHVNASNIAFLLGRNGEALFHADEAIRIREDAGPLAHYDRCLALLGLGRGAAAARSLRRALELEFDPIPEVVRHFTRAARLCEEDGEAELARNALEAAARLPIAEARQAAEDRDQFQRQVSDRVRAAQDDWRRAGSAPGREALLVAILEAAAGRLREADEIATALDPRWTRDPLWIHARWAARGTPEGRTKAVELLRDARTADQLFLRARCEEELGRDADALRDFRAVLAALGPSPDEHDPRAVRSRTAAARLERPCPALPEGPLPSGPSSH